MKSPFYSLAIVAAFVLTCSFVQAQTKVYEKKQNVVPSNAKPEAYAITKGLTLVSLPKQKPMVYEQTANGSWQFREALTSKDFKQNHSFGFSLALNKLNNTKNVNTNRAIVGAPMKSTDATGSNVQEEAGAAYIFEQQADGSWLQVEELMAPNRNAYDHFGWSVSIQGDYALVGINATSDNSSREVCVYKRSIAGKWLFLQSLRIPANMTMDEGFGKKVVLSGNYALISSRSEDLLATAERSENAPVVYVYELGPDGNYLFDQQLDSQQATIQSNSTLSDNADNYMLIGTQSILLLMVMGIGTYLFRNRTSSKKRQDLLFQIAEAPETGVENGSQKQPSAGYSVESPAALPVDKSREVRFAAVENFLVDQDMDGERDFGYSLADTVSVSQVNSARQTFRGQSLFSSESGHYHQAPRAYLNRQSVLALDNFGLN